MRGQLEGRTALVTGASQGVGKVIAVSFAQEGATVVLAARTRAGLESTAAEITAAGGSALVAPTDLREPDDVDALARRIDADVGGLDALVCNAGIAGPTAELWNVTLEEWEETLRVNVTGTFLLCRALLPSMLRRRSGTVVVIGSATGKRPFHGRTPYATSKMALVGLVRTLALELGPAGVRVNLISPGAIDGPRIESVIRAQAQATGSSYDAVYDEFTKASPLRRLVAPADIAAAALFLASDASASITGEDMNVSGGLAMY